MPTVKIQRTEKGMFQRNYSLKNTPAGGYFSVVPMYPRFLRTLPAVPLCRDNRWAQNTFLSWGISAQRKGHADSNLFRRPRIPPCVGLITCEYTTSATEKGGSLQELLGWFVVYIGYTLNHQCLETITRQTIRQRSISMTIFYKMNEYWARKANVMKPQPVTVVVVPLTHPPKSPPKLHFSVSSQAQAKRTGSWAKTVEETNNVTLCY